MVFRNRLSRNRSEEHTSELQSRLHLVCRLLLEKKQSHGKCANRRATHPVHGNFVNRGFRSVNQKVQQGGKNSGKKSDQRASFFLLTRQTRDSPLFPYAALFR